MQGVKYRVMQNPVFIDMFTSLGGAAVPMAWGETFTAVQQGTIDGLEIPLAVIESNKYFEVTKFLSLTNHTYSAIGLVISKRSLDKLPADLRKTVQTAATAAIATALIALLRGGEQAAAMGRAGYAWAQAEAPASADRLVERLFEAYFTEGVDIGVVHELVRLAAEAGCDPDAARAHLESAAGRAELARADDRMKSMGIGGVPFFIFNRRVAVSGAQPPELLADALAQAQQAT